MERPNNMEKNWSCRSFYVDRIDSTQPTFSCKWRVKKKGGGQKGVSGRFFFFFINGTEWLKRFFTI